MRSGRMTAFEQFLLLHCDHQKNPGLMERQPGLYIDVSRMIPCVCVQRESKSSLSYFGYGIYQTGPYIMLCSCTTNNKRRCPEWWHERIDSTPNDSLLRTFDKSCWIRTARRCGN